MYTKFVLLSRTLTKLRCCFTLFNCQSIKTNLYSAMRRKRIRGQLTVFTRSIIGTRSAKKTLLA